MTNKSQQLDLFGDIDVSPVNTSVVASEDIRLVRVAFENGGDNLYDYALNPDLDQEVTVGQRVKVPFGRRNRLQTGFCVDFPDKADVKKVKMVQEILDTRPLLNEHMMQLAQWISQYYCYSLGAVLSAMVPAAVKRQIGMVKRTYVQLTESGREFSADDMTGLRVSAKGRTVLAHLQENYSEFAPALPMDELTEELQCGKGPFRTLEKVDLVEIFQQQEMDHPTAKHITLPDNTSQFQLNDDQFKACGQIQSLIDQDAFTAVLLHGVTGSGKTEVYIQCIEKIVAQGKQALVLVPEIALTPQTESRFLCRFKNVAVLHSGMTNSERHKQWRWIADGGADVVVGARSAVFAPLSNLGLVVVDEEHEASYKQDSTPRYHGRDVAIKRAHLAGTTIILGSATPSMETLHNCFSKDHYHRISLPRRVKNLPLPKVDIVNMRTETLERKGNHLLSRKLENALRKCVSEKHQGILLLNRRGHSNFLFCPSCQFVVSCPNCDVSLTYHKRKQDFDSDTRTLLMCHYCLHSTRVPKMCPLCSKKLIPIGPGTQRVEEEFKRKLPDIRIQRVDSDSMKPGSYEKVLAQFGAGEIDVLMGTQMIGKGLDFPNVSLVGVINADTALSVPDFRSGERTFQLIAQVAGRCGRSTDNGTVIVQSYSPDEPAIEQACRHDFNTFANHELKIRKGCQMPPYSRVARIILRDASLEKTEAEAKRLKQGVDEIIAHYQLAVHVRGPMPASIARMENYHRQEIMFRAPTAGPIQKLLAELRQHHLPSMKVITVVDVDPLSLM